MKNTTNDLSWQEFTRVEMRVGTILEAEVFKEARNPAYKIMLSSLGFSHHLFSY